MPLPAGHPPFSSFLSFHGVWAAKPLFYWLECKFVIFVVFVRNPRFWAGQKHGLPKAPFLGPRENSQNKKQIPELHRFLWTLIVFSREKNPEFTRGPRFLVNLFLVTLVRIWGFSSLFSAIAVFFSTLWQNVLKILRLLGEERKTKKSSLI